VQPRRGAREAPLAHHFDENAQPPGVDRYSHMEYIL
jgi:hypothetical protein